MNTMTTTDFRALCAELADELDAETGYTKNDGERITHTAVASARAAIERWGNYPAIPDSSIQAPPPEPQEPVIPDQYKGHQLHVYRAGFHAGYKHGLTRAPAALATVPTELPTDKELLMLGNDLMGDCLLCEPDLLLNFARAALERWGR